MKQLLLLALPLAAVIGALCSTAKASAATSAPEASIMQNGATIASWVMVLIWIGVVTMLIDWWLETRR